MSFFKKDMQRAFSHKGFWIAVVIATVILTRAMSYGAGDLSIYEYIVEAMAGSGFGPFAAIFPVMGYAVAFCEEYHSGYIRMITSRMSWKQYGVIRMITTAVSGGMIIAIPFTVVMITAYRRGENYIPDICYGYVAEYYIENYGYAYILIGKVVLGFLFGALWALAGMAFSVWFCNRYVALIAPFVLYEVMWVVFYNYQIINPIYLMRGDDLNSYPLSAAMEMVYIVLAVIIIWKGLKRRVHYE